MHLSWLLGHRRLPRVQGVAVPSAAVDVRAAAVMDPPLDADQAGGGENPVPAGEQPPPNVPPAVDHEPQPGDIVMDDVNDARVAKPTRLKLPDAPAPDKRRVMNAEGARKVGLPVRSYIEFTLDELEDMLAVAGYVPSDPVATRWLFLQFSPLQTVMDLREAVAALDPRVVPDMAWLKAWFRDYVTSAEGAAVFNGIRRLKSAKAYKTVEEAVQLVTDLKRELPPKTPDAVYVYILVDLAPDALKDRFMYDRSTEQKKEWTDLKAFLTHLKNFAEEVKTYAASGVKGGVSGSGAGPSGSGRPSSVGRERPSSVARERPTSPQGKRPKGLGMPDRIPQSARFRRPTTTAKTIWVKGLNASDVEDRKGRKVCLLCESDKHFAQDCPQGDSKYSHGDFFFYERKKP